jgi:hypothetical protein
MDGWTASIPHNLAPANRARHGFHRGDVERGTGVLNASGYREAYRYGRSERVPLRILQAPDFVMGARGVWGTAR